MPYDCLSRWYDELFWFTSILFIFLKQTLQPEHSKFETIYLQFYEKAYTNHIINIGIS